MPQILRFRPSTLGAIAFVALALGMLAIPYSHGRIEYVDDLLLNLAPEVIGIAVTLAIVDRMLDHQRAGDESRRIAWRALHRLDHAVWVWQGGTRRFDLDELLHILEMVEDDDPIPPFTQNLLLVLGSVAEVTLRVDSGAVATSPALREALKQLSGLSAMRDKDDILQPREVSNVLQMVTPALGRAAGLRLSDSEPNDVILLDLLMKVRNPSEDAQRWRHYGERPLNEALPELVNGSPLS